MAIVAPAMTTLLSGYLGANSIFGISSTLLSSAISNGFSQYAVAGVTVNTSDVGSAGAGAGAGIGVNLPFPTVNAIMTAEFEAAQIRGPMKQSLITAISSTLISTMLLANIATINTGVGTGVGKVSLVSNSLISVPIMIANFAAFTLVGVSSPVLATAIARGIDQVLLLGTGIVTITGSATPTPATGVGVGKIF